MTRAGVDGKISNVLLVEDDPGDVRLTQEAFREANPSVYVQVANDGVEAIIFLRHEGSDAHAPRPDMILLDLNLPRMDGRQVLAEIKKDDSLRMIPTVFLTTSERQADVSKACELRANFYLNKPVPWDGFSTIIASLNRFWAPEITAKLRAQMV
jgi:chemotaxis family two-component system response regulator Rcp1